MRSSITYFFYCGLLICSTLLLAAPARASHLLGAELFYQYLSTTNGNETYRVTMKLFADCGSNTGSGSAYAGLPTAMPGIRIQNGNTLVNVIALSIVPYPESDIEITPVCPAQQDSTKCKSISYALPGVKKFTYTALVTLPSRSANWQFIFTGDLNNGTSAGRSAIIGNLASIAGGAGSLLTLIATLNNEDGPNSSTEFTSEPTPFFCVNKAQEYNLGAIDPDGDRLTVSLVSALESTLANSPYVNPYTPTSPIATVPGSLVFNPVTGQLSFTPNTVMNGVVVNRVDEFRNGVRVGSSMREMTFVIIPNCVNDAPEPGFIEGLSGAFNSALNEVSTCIGQTDVLSFNFTCTDPNGENITISYNGLPPGASITVANNNTTSPTLYFSWDISNVTPGTYTFFVTFKDDGCPLSSRQTIGYTIKIQPLMSYFDSGMIVGCRYENNSELWIHTNIPDTTIYNITWWDQSSNVLQTTVTTTGDTLRNLRPGSYNVLVRNSRGCVANTVLTVPDPPYHASFTTDTAICIGDPAEVQNTSTSDFTSWSWDFGDGFTSTTRDPSHTYDSAGLHTIRLIATTDFPCPDTAYGRVWIDSMPHVRFDIDKDRVCEGELMYFTPHATAGADSTIWTFGNSVIRSPARDAQPMSFLFDQTGQFTVSMNVFYGTCPDSTFSDTVYVFPFPIVNLRPDTSICPNGEPIQLSNLAATSPGVNYQWSNGESAPGILVYEPGTYSLTATGDGECATTDSVWVARSCYLDVPNIFTPNGDGVNDYFFPRELMSMRLTRFSMTVYNRWGTKLYETSRTDGRGWDGRFNGEMQPGGVYVYVIKAQIDNHIEENRQGNVTLLR